jgi:hypothetical protein
MVYQGITRVLGRLTGEKVCEKVSRAETRRKMGTYEGTKHE